MALPDNTRKTKTVIHIPIASSITITEGSSPYFFITRFEVKIPVVKEKTINKKSTTGMWKILKKKINNAARLPTVPLAFAEYPVKKKLEKRLLKKSIFAFASTTILSLISLNRFH